jgi:hypothetical protein
MALGLTSAAVGLAPAQAQAAPMLFERDLSCTIAGKYTATAHITFELPENQGLVFQWKTIRYSTSPGFKADYVSFGYGQKVKIRLGKLGAKHAVGHKLTVHPENKFSALPAHLVMKVLTQQGTCIARFI